MGFEIRFIGDGDLPVGCDWAAARDLLGRCYLFVKVAACKLLDGVLRPPAAALRTVEEMIGLLAVPQLAAV